MALPVRSLGTVWPTKAIVSAIITAAPRPCAARAAISSGKVGARDAASEAALNSARPAMSSSRRPTRSPNRPTLTMSAVMAKR